MKLNLKQGQELSTFINILGNEISESINFKIFLIFKEFLNKMSFRDQITLQPDGEEITIARKIIVKPPPSNASEIDSLGEIKIRSSSLNYECNLPGASFSDTNDNNDKYLGVRIIVGRKKIRFVIRKDE